MCSTVRGASFGYVSNSKVPFVVSTTMTGPAPGVGCAGAGGRGRRGVCGAGLAAGLVWADAIAARPAIRATTSSTRARIVKSFRSAGLQACSYSTSVGPTSARPIVAVDARLFPTLVTPILGQSAEIVQSPQRGYTGRQTFCPHVTRYRLM